MVEQLSLRKDVLANTYVRPVSLVKLAYRARSDPKARKQLHTAWRGRSYAAPLADDEPPPVPVVDSYSFFSAGSWLEEHKLCDDGCFSDQRFKFPMTQTHTRKDQRDVLFRADIDRDGSRRTTLQHTRLAQRKFLKQTVQVPPSPVAEPHDHAFSNNCAVPPTGQTRSRGRCLGDEEVHSLICAPAREQEHDALPKKKKKRKKLRSKSTHTSPTPSTVATRIRLSNDEDTSVGVAEATPLCQDAKHYGDHESSGAVPVEEVMSAMTQRTSTRQQHRTSLTSIHRASSFNEIVDRVMTNMIKALQGNNLDPKDVNPHLDLTALTKRLPTGCQPTDYASVYCFETSRQRKVLLMDTSISIGRYNQNEAAILAAMAISARRATRLRGTDSGADISSGLLEALAAAGTLETLAQGMIQGATLPESAGGRALLSLLADAAEHLKTREYVQQLFVSYPVSLCRVCRAVLECPEIHLATRLDVSCLLQYVALDDEVRNILTQTDPTILQIALALMKEPLPLLHRFVRIYPRKRFPSNTRILASSHPTAARHPFIPLECSSTVTPFASQHPPIPDPSPHLAAQKIPNDLSHLSQNTTAFRDYLATFLCETSTKTAEEAAASTVANILSESVRIKHLQRFLDASGHEVLGQLLLRHQENPSVLATCLETFVEASERNERLRTYLIQDIEPHLEVASIVQNDRTVSAYLDLLADAIVDRRTKLNGNELSTEVKRLRHRIGQVARCVEESNDLATFNVSTRLQLLSEVAPEGRELLTLREAHGCLINRKIMKETLVLSEARALRRLYEFIKETTSVYLGTTISNVDTFEGQEIMYGCLSLQMLGELPQNESYLTEDGLPATLLDGMRKQKNEAVVQYVVHAAVDLCERSFSLAEAFAKHDHGANIATDIVTRGRVATEATKGWETEDVLGPRLALIRGMAVDRSVFAKTPVCTELMLLWDRADRSYYGRVRFLTKKELTKLARREQRETALRRIGSMFRGVRRGRVTTETATVPLATSTRSTPAKTTQVSPLTRRRSVRTPSNKRNMSHPTRGTTGRGRLTARPSQSVTIKRRSKHRKGFAADPHITIDGESDLSSQEDFNDEDEEWPADEDDGPPMLLAVIQTLRKVLCSNFFRPLQDNQALQRLIGLMIDRDTNPAILPDVLFLIGALSADGNIKQELGSLKAVEKTVDLIRRAYLHDGLYVSEVVTNGCLALANLCIMDGPNTARFNRHRGTELVVKVLNKRGEMNDDRSVNGASALICNLCFKHEKMKEALGSKGACEALVEAMRGFRNSSGAAGSRNIACLFKAIGNLALTGKNMHLFVRAEIAEAFVEFMQQADSELDDATLEACFRTVANLVIEKDSGVYLGVTLLPMLSLLRKTHKSSPEIYRWAFEAMGNLCRLPNNALSLAENQGIQTILSMVSILDDSEALYGSALFVLGMQTRNKETIPILISEGIFEFCSQVLELYLSKLDASEAQNQNITEDKGEATLSTDKAERPATQVAVSAARCIYRVLTTEEYAQHCINSGCFNVVMKAFHRGYKKTMLSYEIMRVFFKLVSLLQEKSAAPALLPQQHDETGKANLMKRASMGLPSRQNKVANAALHMRKNSILPATAGQTTKNGRGGCAELTNAQTAYGGYGDEDEPRDRIPLGQRSWERMGLSDRDITSLIVTTRRCLAEDSALRDLRLIRVGIGLLSYFACEKKGFDALYDRLETDETASSKTQEPTPKWDKQRRKSLLPQASKQLPRNTVTSVKPRFAKRVSMLFVKQQSGQSLGEDQSPFGKERLQDKTSLIDCIHNALTTYAAVDHYLVEEAFILLSHLVLCAISNTEMEAVADVEFYKQVKKLIQDNPQLPRIASESLSLYKVFLDNGYGTSTDDMLPFYFLVDLEFPLDLSGYRDDPYPDGVQSLPSEIKQFLRKGGKLDLYEALAGSKPRRVDCFWRASHDLIQFMWKICETKQKLVEDIVYPNSVVVSTLRGILPGVNNSVFAHIAKLLSLSESQCFNLIGSNNTINLNLRAKSQSERDMLVNVISLWRDAAAYGFR